MWVWREQLRGRTAAISGGPLFLSRNWKRSGAQLLPVNSEENRLF
jgi:hypothetical protein